MLKKGLLLLTAFLAGGFVFAHGKGDIDEIPVAQMDSWQETFDINKKKTGKFNVMVTAEDQGGNVTVGGPYNIFIDPDSDYTISGITNPIKGMRVPGNLNIVGTCIDDDGVEEVWLILDGAEPVKAEGKEFWSYYLDTTELSEGPHTIEVFGVDINGLSSQSKPKKKAYVTWNLDRRKPVTEVTNYALGTLVSGKIELKGTVYDGNGIKSLQYSLDGGKNYFDVKISENKKAGNWTFSLPINTKLAEDGASLCWFKATDKMGSVGINSFLYFVDNTKPDVKIVSPAPDEVMNGKFGIAGYAKDTIGIKSIKWEFNGKSGEFELVPGNPYWYLPVDTTNGGKSADVVITATDTVNNVVVVKRTIKLNQEADKPVVEIQYPKADMVVDGTDGSVYVRGSASDDDAVASVTYKIDDKPAVTLETPGAFYANLAEAKTLSAGKHSVTVFATDVNGVAGNPVTVNFISKGVLPEFKAAKISGKAVTQGALIHPESNPVYETSVTSDCGFNSVTYTVECGSEAPFLDKAVTLKKGDKSASVSIPLGTAPWGLVTVNVKATDIYDRTVEQKTVIDLKDLTYIHNDLIEGGIESKIENLLCDAEAPVQIAIAAVAGQEYKPGMKVELPYGPKSSVLLTANVESQVKPSSVSYVIEGENETGGEVKQMGKGVIKPVDATHYIAEIPLANLPCRITYITLTAEAAKLAPVSCKGTVLIVRPAPAQVSAFVRGGVYNFPAENVKYDELNKRYLLAAGTPFTMYANVELPVTAELASAQNGLSVSVEGKTITVTAEKDALYKNVSVKVRDASGKEYVSPAVTLLVDSALPAAEIESPVLDSWVQTGTRLSVKASDDNSIASVEYSTDEGEIWTAAKTSDGAVYTADINLVNRVDGLIPVDVRATDIAGKVFYTHTAIKRDTTPPEVEVIVPGAEDIVNGDNLIAFRVKDNNGHFTKAEYYAPKTGKTASAPVDVELGPMVVTHVGTVEKPINDLMSFKFYDEIGNVTTIQKWDFLIDAKSDLPIAEVHLPEDNAVISTDFTISGVVIDDDGPSKVYYKLDNGEFQPTSEDYGTSFAIDVPLSSLKDNEHSVTVYAEDLNGVKGPEFVRKFRVSLEEPKGAVVTPPISQTVKGFVTLTGNATDKNGISKVFISVDNGNTFNEATGDFSHEKTSSNWNYEFDTRVVEDGTHVVFLKIVDWYGIEGLYSSLINIDNTAPSINLELPLDDSKTTKMLFFSGQTTDNIGLTKLNITIRSLEGKTVNQKLAHIDLVPGEIITQSIDMSSLDNGFYNVELTGTDAAQNITRVSRNVQLDKNMPVAKVDMLYPLNGEFVQGVFNIYGTAVSEIPIDTLELLVDGTKVAETTLTASGYYKFNLNPELITDGQHKVQVKANLANARTIMSNEQYVNYSSVGPWVTIDNFTYGDFAIDRPYIVGNAGYSISEEELIASKAKGASKEIKAAVAAKSVEKVEISFNNGKSFETVAESGKWRYRVENEDIAEGYHFLLVRATMLNGEKAVTRTIVQVDKTKPVLKLISPGEGGSYNQQLEFSGLAHDDIALKSVTLALRKGDKASYEVPSFIQGLYFDWHFWGATLFDVGVGLSFFDDNVRLQAQWGQFTQEQRNLFSQTSMRYGGDNIIGGKLLANVAYIPFRYFLGPDWEWLSANVTLGANFTRFNETGSGKPQILSAVLAQLEFPRISFAKQKMFRTIAFYTEGQLWFIPTDVSSTVDIENMVPQISVGLRVNVF